MLPASRVPSTTTVAMNPVEDSVEDLAAVQAAQVVTEVLEGKVVPALPEDQAAGRRVDPAVVDPVDRAAADLAGASVDAAARIPVAEGLTAREAPDPRAAPAVVPALATGAAPAATESTARCR
jgi:hypothetical protein